MNQADPIDSAAAGEPPDEAAIAAYLERHPDFFDRHPDALAAINASHDAGRAVSLIERQVGVLRATHRQLQSRYNQLVETARDNEQRVVALNRLAQVFVAAATVEALVRDLNTALRSQLDVDAVYLGIDTAQPLPASIESLAPGQPGAQALTNVFRRGRPICGALSAEQARTLFAAAGEPLASAAAIPLGKRGTHGALVLASTRPERFVPDMGTLFLELTGQLATTALRRVLGESLLP